MLIIFFEVSSKGSKGSCSDRYQIKELCGRLVSPPIKHMCADQTLLQYLSDECIPQIARFSRYSGAEISPYDLGYYRDYNRVVGAIRIRQVSSVVHL